MYHCNFDPMGHFLAKTHRGRSLPAGIYAAADQTTERPRPTHDEIARLAHSYWEARGRRGGSAEDDWYRAERELSQSDGDSRQS
jgi:hypothetical protein